MDVYSVLSEIPVSATEVKDRSNVARSTAYRVLRELAGYGLAAETDKGWVRGPLSPDEAAEHRGWTGKNSVTIKRRVQFAQDRWEYGRLVKASERMDSPGNAVPTQLP